MTHLLCLVGLHHAAWTPHVRGNRETWLHIRTCTRCGNPIPRKSHP